MCLLLCNTNTNGKSGSTLNCYADTSLDTGIWKFILQHGTVQLPKPGLVRTQCKLQQLFHLTLPWTVWKRWKVEWHHWKAPRKFHCKSHSFFHSCAVPPNEQTREILSKWWWGEVGCLLLLFCCCFLIESALYTTKHTIIRCEGSEDF